MNTIQEKLIYFKQKQQEMIALDAEIKPKLMTLNQEYQTKAQEIQKPLIEAGEKYKAELKAFCGITDGERTNVLELLECMIKMQGMA